MTALQQIESELRQAAEDRRRLDWVTHRLPMVLAEEGFDTSEIDDILQRLTPPGLDVKGFYI